MKKHLEAWLAKLFCNAVKQAVEKELMPSLDSYIKAQTSLLSLLGKSCYVRLSVSHPINKGDQVVIDLAMGTATPIAWYAAVRTLSTLVVYSRIDLPETVSVPFNVSFHADPLTVFSERVEIVKPSNQLKGFKYF